MFIFRTTGSDTATRCPQKITPVLFASMSSVVLRDRIFRPAILPAVNANAKLYIHASFPHDDGTWICFTLCIHSWRYKEADTWKALFEIDQYLASKKPLGDRKPLCDWRCCMTGVH